jgi:predicted nucleotidyltransferase
MDERWILPIGTQVVTLVDMYASNEEILFPSGAVGFIVKSPSDNTHHYRVRFPDGSEGSFRRQQLVIRKHYQTQSAIGGEPPEISSLLQFVIYRCIVGSRAYGLDQDGSDIDRRGIYLPPADQSWSLFGIPEQIERQETQEGYWELQKFLILALKANPNALECLYTPLVEHATPLAEELLALKSIFLSKLIYQTYNGYVLSQFRKLDQDIRNQGTIKWKHAMHLIRLLLSGVTVLKEGFVPVRIDDHRRKLLEIRSGSVRWEDVNDWRVELHKKFDEAFAATKLPDRPDYEVANDFLIKARRSTI